MSSKKNNIYIDNQDLLNSFVQEILPESHYIALDTEFERRTTFFPKPALLQLHIANKSYLIDTLALDDLNPLFKTLTEKKIIMHACREDLEVFRVLSKHRLDNFSDTQLAASLLGYDSQLSYQNLVEQLLDKRLDKNETCSDWLQRPLSENQLAYAIDDVLYLEDIYQLLMAKLTEKERKHWFHEEMQVLYNLVDSPEEDDYFFKFKGLGKLNPLQQSVAYDLIVWRDQLARQKNIPRGFIIKDKGLLQIIRASDHKNVKQLHGMEDVPSGFVRKHEAYLNQLFGEQSESIKKQSAIERISWKEPEAAKHLKKHLKKHRDHFSQELDIRSEVLLSNKTMTALCEGIYFHKAYTEADLCKILLPWRYQLFKTSLEKFF